MEFWPLMGLGWFGGWGWVCSWGIIGAIIMGLGGGVSGRMFGSVVCGLTIAVVISNRKKIIQSICFCS